MPSIQIRVILNYIKRLAPAERRVSLNDLLTEFPDDWLNEAIASAQGIRQARQIQAPVPPRYVDPRLRRRVP